MNRLTRLFTIVIALIAVIAVAIYVPHVIHQTVETRQPGQRYLVSLGDSVAAGAGLNPGGEGCDLAVAAYPFLLADKLHEPVVQYACSGATLTGNGSKTVASQIAAARPFISGGDVTLTAGANDIGWLSFLTSCSQTDCATKLNDTKLTASTERLRQAMTQTVRTLWSMHPHRVVVNTYYGLIRPDDTCLARLGISPAETAFIARHEALLNTAITTGAQAGGAMVVQVDYTGHELCDKASWLQDLQAPAPLHPTKAGQVQIATQDQAALSE